MGYIRHMPRVVIFGPATYGGSGLVDAKVEQAVHLITDMITEIQRSTLVGKQFVFLIANYQRYLGTSHPFFSRNPDDFPHNPVNSRITTLIWKKMYSHNVSVSSTKWWTPQSRMANDTAVMDAFIIGQKRLRGPPAAISDTMLCNANAVRLSLQCTFLSKISSNNMTKISDWATLGGPPSQGSESYPDQQAPTDRMVRHWRQLLRSCFLLSTNLIVHPPSHPTPPTPALPPASFTEYLLANEYEVSTMGIGVRNHQDSIATFLADPISSGLLINALAMVLSRTA